MVEGDEFDDNKQCDFLSKMPDDILSSIISSLSIRDVAKLRTLSRAWRYICPFNYNLEFDTDSVLGGKVWNLAEGKSKFVRGVGQCLKFYEGHKIDSLRILFPLEEEYAYHIDSWISFAVRAGAQKLDLDFHCFPSPRDNIYNFSGPILFECKPFQLKYLRLYSCKLRPSPYLGGIFISLKELNLIEVSLDKTSTETIISNGLNLEWLRLRSCSLPETLSIKGTLLHLKSLIFHGCRGVEKIDISSTSLTTFEYLSSMVINLSFHEVPCLEKVHISFLRNYAKALEYMYNRLPHDVPHLQHLSASVLALKVPPVPLRITKFYHLKQLDLFLLHGYDDSFDLLSLTFILNAAPHLQKFCLAANCRCRHAGQLDYINHVHYELKEVEVHGFKGSANEMEFVIYLLKNALTLKQMTLSPHTLMYHLGGRWGKGTNWLSDKKRQYVHDSLKEFVKCNMNLVLL